MNFDEFVGAIEDVEYVSVCIEIDLCGSTSSFAISDVIQNINGVQILGEDNEIFIGDNAKRIAFDQDENCYMLLYDNCQITISLF